MVFHSNNNCFKSELNGLNVLNTVQYNLAENYFKVISTSTLHKPDSNALVYTSQISTGVVKNF